MASAKAIASLVIAATIAMTLFGPVVATVSDTTGSQSVTNESVTAETGTYVDLDGYDVDDSETVYWYNESSSSYETVSEGSDYEMNYSAGSIQALESGSIAEGDELQVTYDYQATSGSVTTIAVLVPTFMALLVLGVMASKITDGL